MISLFSEYPQLTDVFKHSPIICWLTIISATENNCSREYLASLLQKKRPLIVEKLCGVKSQEYVKFINKIQLLKAGKTEYKLIMKSILNAELVRSFKHWPSISLQALKVVDKYPCFIGSKLLNTMLDTQKSNHFNRMQFFYLHETIDDIKRLKRSLGKSLSEDDVKYIENPTQLENIHDKWTTRFNNSEQCRLHALRASRPAQRQQVHEEVSDENTIFPVCPIGDLANFIQIKCRDELSEEGIYMQHCVGSYAGKAERGASYIYKLLAPERATVEIQLTGNKILATQFKLVRNHKPSQQSYDYLREILTNYGSIEK